MTANNETQTCKAVKWKGVCGNRLHSAADKERGFCSVCWEPGIVEKHTAYQALRRGGASRAKAGELAGLFEPEEELEEES
jgi:hypothetical protein